MTKIVVLDTSVISRLTKPDEESLQYTRLLGPQRIAMSFQTQAELLSSGFGSARQARLGQMSAISMVLDHQFSTSQRYAQIADVRKALRRLRQPGSDASDGDMWVIASALEHNISLLSHDRQQIALAREVSLPTFTNLPTLRDANPAPG